MYDIAVDRTNRRVEVTFIGSYTDIDQADFSRALRTAMLQAKGHGDHFDLLSDFTGTSVMPQDRTDSAREEIEWCLANGLRRSAHVVSSVIAKMQLQRLSGDDRFRNFASRAEAVAWLSSPD